MNGDEDGVGARDEGGLRGGDGAGGGARDRDNLREAGRAGGGARGPNALRGLRERDRPAAGAGAGGRVRDHAGGRAGELAVLRQAAAHCLAYPDDAFRTSTLPLLTAALAPLRHPAAEPLRAFAAEAAATPAGRLAACYVDTFDFTGRHSLHLTWWTDGDTRRRGAALVRFKETYRAHGLEFGDADLPDFLPAVLEFTAATGSDALLREHRPALELLRLALAEHGTPYARVLASVCAGLPGPSPEDRAAALALARGGPPREDVGLDSLAPYGHLSQLPLLTPGPTGGRP